LDSSAPAAATELARELRGSSRRRVWSTLLDPRDWPSYVYVLAALLLFVSVPLQVYQLYRRAQMQATVINAIASGDPDFRQVLDLLDKDPTSDWANIAIGEKAEPTELDIGAETPRIAGCLICGTGIRRSDAGSSGPRLLRDRVTSARRLKSSPPRHVSNVLPLEEAEFRQPKGRLQAASTRENR
jgi:hypothetical protein